MQAHSGKFYTYRHAPYQSALVCTAGLAEAEWAIELSVFLPLTQPFKQSYFSSSTIPPTPHHTTPHSHAYMPTHSITTSTSCTNRFLTNANFLLHWACKPAAIQAHRAVLSSHWAWCPGISGLYASSFSSKWWRQQIIKVNGNFKKKESSFMVKKGHRKTEPVPATT